MNKAEGTPEEDKEAVRQRWFEKTICLSKTAGTLADICQRLSQETLTVQPSFLQHRQISRKLRRFEELMLKKSEEAKVLKDRWLAHSAEYVKLPATKSSLLSERQVLDMMTATIERARHAVQEAQATIRNRWTDQITRVTIVLACVSIALGILSILLSL